MLLEIRALRREDSATLGKDRDHENFNATER
jgi:hypothetical protein